MKAAPGISAFYRKLNNSDTRFHYVSGSPWQLFPVLDEFLGDNSFPAGSINMKEFRANPGSSEFWDFFVSGATQKLIKGQRTFVHKVHGECQLSDVGVGLLL